MTIKDILKPEKPIKNIIIRTNYPKNFPEVQNSWFGILFGSCSWDGKNLISLDGDNYNLDDEIYGYIELEDSLIIWIKS
jgi:hypothetical protein